MKCNKIQEKDKINTHLLNKKKQKLKEKGITLIALVVTIIILLILAGVTLNMALSGDGLFSEAREAAEKYKKAQEDEAKLISEIGKEMNSEYVGAYVEGYEPTEGTYIIEGNISGLGESNLDSKGNEINNENLNQSGVQTFTTENEIKWRIWDYDGTTLRIISEKPTKAQLTLKGATGYNNGVYLINEICRKCYGSTTMNGVSVSNLKRSDIQDVITYDYTKFNQAYDSWEEVTEGTEKAVKFGETKTYKTNFKFPKVWQKDREWSYELNGSKNDKECLLWEKEYGILDEEEPFEMGDKDTKFKESYWVHNFLHKEYEFKDELYYNLIFPEKGIGVGNNVVSWLTGRSVRLYANNCWFGIGVVNDWGGYSLVGNDCLFGSDGYVENYTRHLRPVVSINLDKSGYSLKKIETDEGIKYELSNK